MAAKAPLQQFILLPTRGLRAQETTASASVKAFFTSINPEAKTPKGRSVKVSGAPKLQMRVLDSIGKNGAKLVELPAESLSDLKAAQPGMRIVPITYYYPAVVQRPTVRPMLKAFVAAASATKITIKVVSRADGKPVAGADVIAFTNFSQRLGAQGKTNKSGRVSLSLGTAVRKLDRLYIYPEVGFYSLLRTSITISSQMELGLRPVDLTFSNFSDALRHFYGNTADDIGQGVKVAVIDTGIAINHPDLSVDGGMNTVLGEDSGDYDDNGHGHGTHVAGIISAHGLPPTGVRGVAPAVTLRSYRVFGEDEEGASNFAIAKAIDQAITDKCDLINMSLGGGPDDAAVRSAIADARAQGCLVIVANGNDYREPVSFPASDSLSLAVSAMGRLETFPSDSTAVGDIDVPRGKDPKNFVAAFSNIGPETDLIGPGVDIVSTVPGGYAPMSGTSMACPAVTGIAARLLAARPKILAMSRDRDRSDEMAKLVLKTAVAQGFGPDFEGQGRLP